VLNQINFRIIPHTALGFSKINVAHTHTERRGEASQLLWPLFSGCLYAIWLYGFWPGQNRTELNWAVAVAAFRSCFNHLNAAHCFRPGKKGNGELGTGAAVQSLNSVAVYLHRGRWLFVGLCSH